MRLCAARARAPAGVLSVVYGAAQWSNGQFFRKHWPFAKAKHLPEVRSGLGQALEAWPSAPQLKHMGGGLSGHSREKCCVEPHIWQAPPFFLVDAGTLGQLRETCSKLPQT